MILSSLLPCDAVIYFLQYLLQMFEVKTKCFSVCDQKVYHNVILDVFFLFFELCRVARSLGLGTGSARMVSLLIFFISRREISLTVARF